MSAPEHEVLPQIPNGRFRLTFREPQFTHWEIGGYSRWALVGPAEKLPLGKFVHVPTREGHEARVLVAEYVAERVVHPRPKHWDPDRPREVRYVVARINY